MKYILTAVEFRQVTSRNEKGDVTGIRRYRQGDVIELTGSEEQRLLRAGALAPLDASHSDHVHTDPGEASPNTGDGAEKPRKAAPVDDWRDFAVAQGFDRGQVDEMTKAELIAAVG
ncbi:hypothetical protein [Tsukamurella tyrosinosolvens]|uniref:hypothetical protein n=1 Tax=Tsukamurella tyrosinosolvens TaxID=57704 RepID=UPI003462A248